ncbi:hypothetical protein J1614_005049 [Plenodomus biglobosus]|nr:hypothetical protein J1614_005049 [Plenodomus biglobosus]
MEIRDTRQLGTLRRDGSDERPGRTRSLSSLTLALGSRQTSKLGRSRQDTTATRVWAKIIRQATMLTALRVPIDPKLALGQVLFSVLKLRKEADVSQRTSASLPVDTQ